MPHSRHNFVPSEGILLGTPDIKAPKLRGFLSSKVYKTRIVKHKMLLIFASICGIIADKDEGEFYIPLLDL